jgi:predicted HicB family RNase H-like nuclease
LVYIDPPILIDLSKMSKNKLLNIRIDPELKKKAKKLATEDGRSVSNWVTHLISREVKLAEKKKSGN